MGTIHPINTPEHIMTKTITHEGRNIATYVRLPSGLIEVQSTLGFDGWEHGAIVRTVKAAKALAIEWANA